MSLVLVIGGAGYIGSHICCALSQSGFATVTYDNLSNGDANRVIWGPLEEGDVRDRDRIQEVLRRLMPEAVVFCLAAPNGQDDPTSFYQNDLRAALSALDALKSCHKVPLVFTSDAAVYGRKDRQPLDEKTRPAPETARGAASLMVEQTIQTYAAETGLRFAILRCFSVAGGNALEGLGLHRSQQARLMPVAVKAAQQATSITILGADYETYDGTCIRDYVHVSDVALAHVSAVERLIGGGGNVIVNIGSGRGASVIDVLRAVEKGGGRPISTVAGPRRPGDAGALVADVQSARRALDWKPKHRLSEIIQSELHSRLE